MNEKLEANTMPHERTPLIQVVPVAPPRDRYPHAALRRFCTVALIAIPFLTLAIIFFSITVSGQSDLFGDHPETDPIPFPFRSALLSSSPSALTTNPPHVAWPAGDGLKYEELQTILQETPDAEKTKQWSRYYTAGPHLAGQNLSQAEWTRDRWQEFGIEAEIVAYDVYINYPLDHRLALLKDGEVEFEASLEEEVLEEDPTSGLENRVPTFHGYSASGNVTARYVWVNYGTYADFEELRERGVELEGMIAIARYGGIFRGLKVKRAQELGMVGVVIYSDPGDDGDITELNGYAPYPDGPARNPSSVQRGSVQYLSVAPGDPTTPGYPSKPGVPRVPANNSTPSIPSLPLSYAEALPLLQALNSHGPNASSFSSKWQTGGLYHKNVTYNIGPSPPHLTLNLYNLQNYTTTPLWNVIGRIEGSIPDEVVLLGNHRDAWIAGGAGDPNSGSAVLNEVVRSFGKAVEKGWTPQRTLVFASWDGEEYGLIGSTEWVEEYLHWLDATAVAYLNVDVAAVGRVFEASAAPLLDRALIETTKLVAHPNATLAAKGATVYDEWDKKISTMGSGSDFTAFQDFAGVPCAQVEFGSSSDASANGAVYHYHSNYDSEAWMEKYGDPGFRYHVAIERVWALLAARLSEEPVIAFNATDYATKLGMYVDSIKALAKEHGVETEAKTALKALDHAVANLLSVATAFDTEADALSHAAAALRAGAKDLHEKQEQVAVADLYTAVRSVNSRYKYLERAFLYAKGLDNRAWFKHVVFAPGLWTGYAGATFPGLVEAVEAKDRASLERWAGIITGKVWRAVGVLEG